MEAIRRRLMNDANVYPEFGSSKSASVSSSTSSAQSAVTISSGSSSTSSTSGLDASVAPVAKSKPRVGSRPIIISSDEDESDNESTKFTSAKSNQEAMAPRQAPIKMPVPEPYRPPQPESLKNKVVHRVENIIRENIPHKLPQRPPTGPAMPIPAPSYGQFRAPAPVPGPNLDDDIPDLPSEHAYMSAADAEKALKELMGGSMNEDEDVDIDEEQAYVDGFRDGIKLLPHQIQGRKWMMEREDPSNKRWGGLLADDMGLGKTIQTLTRISDNRPRKADRDEWDPPTLIVCPLALVEQWASEIQKMVKGFTVVRHQGTSRTSDPRRLKNCHVVITTYDTVRSEYQSYKPDIKDEGKGKSSKFKQKASVPSDSDSNSSIESFGRSLPAPKKSASKTKDALFHVRWWRVVLDEAHNIKNRNAKGSIACCELEARFRWCLTGTPLQNEILELYSLLKFLRIKPLSNFQTFNEQIAKPIKNGRGSVRAMKRLQVVLKQVMLRRTKDQTINGKALIELPPRKVDIVACPFDAYEKTFYRTLEEQMSSVVTDLAKQEKASYIGALVLLLRLRQACDHPLLVSKDYKADMEAIDPKASKQGDASQDADDLAAAFGAMNVSRNCALCTTPLKDSNTNSSMDKHCQTCAELARNASSQSGSRPSSAKIRMTLKILREIDERSEGQEKTIIFSQFTSFLDLLEPFLREEGVRYVRYDGSMQAVQREASLTTIKTDPKHRVILVSFKAGSTGLNLTACNNVILLDLWWNPALEDQAFDRAHRYGQTRPVNIFKLKIDDTVEERILELQDKKRELAKAALSGEKMKNMRLGFDELLALFRPGGRDDDEEDF